ncbi:MAG: type II secretion system inner membrane protein GspF [Planctomycetes bacterium]|nr:type II secretion system inner membrane protein GspF [Planctomycetota bacterium]
MPIFQYEALSGRGKLVKGTIDADTARDAREKLRRQEIRVTAMSKVDAARKRKDARKKFTLERKISVRNLAILTRQLSTLLGSGIHLAEALGALIEQVEEKRTEMILRDTREKVVSGINLAEAMSYHPSVFSDLYVNMVRAGEASGNLDEVLNRLADYLQKQASLRGKVIAALTYPGIMMLVGTGVVVFLMSYVVPKITTILESRNQVLPWTTVTLMQVSNLFENYWWVLLVGLLAVMVGLRGFMATEKGRLWFDITLLRVPIVGTLFKKQAISRFTITFSALLKSGLPALDSLRIVSRVVNNTVLTRVLDKVAEHIMEGADISTPLKHSKIFPPMVAYMIAVGEQSGQLEDILDRIADAYDEEIDLAVQKMTAAVEPMIIIGLAVVVGFIIMAVLMPLLQFNNL